MIEADIALYPVGGNLDLEKSKTAYKPLEYAAAKIPTVASPLGLTEFFKNDSEVMLIQDDADWEKHISRLASDESLRKRLAENANHKLKQHHNYRMSFEKLMTAINTPVA